MALKAVFTKRTFHFSFRARTSRGAMSQRDSWFLKIWDDKNPEHFGLGEAGPLPGLSTETPEQVEAQLALVMGRLSKLSASSAANLEALYQAIGISDLSSSVLFALETAWLDFIQGGTRKIFDNSFLKGTPIPINGLVWMGGLDDMLQQVSIKLYDGFNCIKLKIGGINFEKELDILQFIRRKYFRDVVTIRLDANGAFKVEDAMYKLMDCARYDIHSIEQPIRPGLSKMAELCRETPVPIALDEELIGVNKREAKIALLDRIRPQFIILKPSLHGGIAGCAEWVRLAEERQTGWWMTSALESSIGLNAIAQFSAEYPIDTHQGLGTGMIYTDNIASPLKVEKGHLKVDSQEIWDLSEF
ncbi:MAG: o-succinylbenzoate synthase [Cyclobacteriaceae bacterium]